jgi:hypothetical protein
MNEEKHKRQMSVAVFRSKIAQEQFDVKRGKMFVLYGETLLPVTGAYASQGDAFITVDEGAEEKE